MRLISVHKLLFLLIGCGNLLMASAGRAEPSLEQVRLLALAPVEGRAVVQWPDGTMQVVRPGERLQGTTATLRQVLPDYVVVEDASQATDLQHTQFLWIYAAPRTGGPSRLRRFQSHKPAEALPPMQMPIHLPANVAR